MLEQSPDAKNHPLLAEFSRLVDNTFEDGIPDFEIISTPLFTKFWPFFIIHRYEEQNKDFRTVFYGTHIVESYQRDCTGLLLSEMGFGKAEEAIRKLNKQVLDSRERAYNTNTLFWKNREHRVFHQVKMPLRRKGEIDEVLVCMSYA